MKPSCQPGSSARGKEASDGSPAGAPASILNYPYAVNQSMADIGTSNVSVLFGAFNKYLRRMVNEFAIRRLVER